MIGAEGDLLLAVDVGGTKLAAGIVDMAGQLLDRKSVPTPNPTDPEPTASDVLFQTLARLVAGFAPFERFVALGVGCGGPMESGGELVSPLNIPAWREFPLAAELRLLTGLRVAVDNDAKALALAEGWVGAAKGEQNYLAMVVSTGVGGGIVLDGKLLEGGAGNAGHIGHVVVEPEGHDLPGHVRGVLEAEASGTAIAHILGRPAAAADPSEVVRVGVLVGRAVGSVCNLLDLKLALVGGSVALGYGAPFFDAAQRELDRVCQLDHSRGAVIRPVGCGDEGPLIGAAAVALKTY